MSLREYGVQRYINVIPTGVDFSKFMYNPEDKPFLDESKKEHGLDRTFNLEYV